MKSKKFYSWKIIVLAFLFVAFISNFWISCVSAPEYPVEPVLTFISYSKNSMKQNFNRSSDYIDILVGFTDGDGDLGDEVDGKAADVFIFDTRSATVIENYKVPYVAPQGTGNGINGEMTLRYFTTCCKFPDGSIPCTPSTTYLTDTLRYKLFIKDRAGHESNRLVLPPIILQCGK
jgi:hypothetical protein